MGVAYCKKMQNFQMDSQTSKWIYVTWPNFVETHKHTLIGHGLPRPYS